jgi:hypothetical protein
VFILAGIRSLWARLRVHGAGSVHRGLLHGRWANVICRSWRTRDDPFERVWSDGGRPPPRGRHGAAPASADGIRVVVRPVSHAISAARCARCSGACGTGARNTARMPRRILTKTAVPGREGKGIASPACRPRKRRTRTTAVERTFPQAILILLVKGEKTTRYGPRATSRRRQSARRRGPAATAPAQAEFPSKVSLRPRVPAAEQVPALCVPAVEQVPAPCVSAVRRTQHPPCVPPAESPCVPAVE